MSTIDRALASIQRIGSLLPIPEADQIECATILGWNVVVRKNEFQVGELVVYFEIDCWIPNSIAPFLSKGQEPREYEGIKGEMLKTIRLKKQISQGLILPLSILPINKIMEEGEDVTSILGILKYEKPIPMHLAGKVRGNFPLFLQRTDETRIQSMPKVLVDNRWNEEEYYASEKVDGSSETCFLNNDEFGVCSRRMWLTETEDNEFWKAARLLNIETKMKACQKALNLGNFAIQGELLPTKNYYKVNGPKVYWFSCFDIDTQEYMEFDKFNEIIGWMGLETVPILSTNYRLPNGVADILAFAESKSFINPSMEREGIVVRSKRKLENIGGSHKIDEVLSFKVISNKYLLKNND